jgi:hypothetical protein
VDEWIVKADATHVVQDKDNIYLIDARSLPSITVNKVTLTPGGSAAAAAEDNKDILLVTRKVFMKDVKAGESTACVSAGIYFACSSGSTLSVLNIVDNVVESKEENGEITSLSGSGQGKSTFY